MIEEEFPRWLCRYCGKVIPSELSSRPCPHSPDQQHRWGERWYPPGQEPSTEPSDVQAALDRANGLTWPDTPQARIAFAIADRRVLAREVERLTALLKAKGVTSHGS